MQPVFLLLTLEGRGDRLHFIDVKVREVSSLSKATQQADHRARYDSKARFVPQYINTLLRAY